VGVAVLGPVSVEGDADRLWPRDRVVLAALALRPGETLAAGELSSATSSAGLQSSPEGLALIVVGDSRLAARITAADTRRFMVSPLALFVLLVVVSRRLADAQRRRELTARSGSRDARQDRRSGRYGR
jgi:hypothetical protein